VTTLTVVAVNRARIIIGATLVLAMGFQVIRVRRLLAALGLAVTAGGGKVEVAGGGSNASA
jgi:hypothetical protein